MNSEEIKDLLNHAKLVGVRLLEFDGTRLKVHFYPTAYIAPPMDPKEIEEARLKESKRIAEENIAYLKLADPLAYEEALQQRDLESNHNDD